MDNFFQISSFFIPQNKIDALLVGRGKSKKLALTACVRKILVILNAMVRQNQPWQLADNLPPCS
ncbi:transposase [Microcystis aeruginosa NIES-843]|uniref:Transposase n=1 Tax=Microcystis aeruginosa (strain NIES-843 / IAM M-2473) TaxID=449447 RepID=B0JXT9_MICAN|nr:transposase [Microcystis aeruginosa NIES-843]